MNVRLAFLTAVVCVPLAAAELDDWNNLTRLRAEDKIQVVRKNMSTVDAQFVGFSESSIQIRVGNQESVIEKDKVIRVSTRPSGGRTRHAKVGAIVGLGFGALSAAGLARFSSGTAVFSVMVLTGLGAGIGAAIPGGVTTIYRAPPIR